MYGINYELIVCPRVVNNDMLYNIIHTYLLNAVRIVQGVYMWTLDTIMASLSAVV